MTFGEKIRNELLYHITREAAKISAISSDKIGKYEYLTGGKILPSDQRQFFLIGIHSMQGWRATTRHGFTRKRNTKRLRHTWNLFRKNLKLKDVF